MKFGLFLILIVSVAVNESLEIFKEEQETRNLVKRAGGQKQPEMDYTWIYVGGVIGVIFVIGVIVTVVICMKKRKLKAKKTKTSKTTVKSKSKSKTRIGDLSKEPSKEKVVKPSAESTGSKESQNLIDGIPGTPPTALTPESKPTTPSPVGTPEDQQKGKSTLVISLNEPPIQFKDMQHSRDEGYFQATGEDPTIVESATKLTPGEMV